MAHFNPVSNIANIVEYSPIEQSLAEFYKAAGDCTRLAILRVLRNDSFGVQELAFIFSMAQPAMSHHLKVMVKGGLIRSRRQGNTIFYRRVMLHSQRPFQGPLATLFDEVDGREILQQFQCKINKVYQDRSKRSQLFFEKNSQQFIKKQGLICQLGEYLMNMRELLDLAGLSKTARVLEVGPGYGEFLRELSGRYSNLYALDRSKKILEVAKKQMASSSKKIHFICQAFEEYCLPERTAFFDAVILNMALHHMSSPSFIFNKVSELLGNSGHFLVADLASHQQDWVKEACGDLWLGFDPEDLKTWAQNEGFSEKQSLYLGLKNGFQIQLRLFQKITNN